MSDPIELRPALPRHPYPAIPENDGTMQGLLSEVAALRALVQIFMRDNGNVFDSFVSLRDLVDMGIITPSQVLELKRGGAILDRAKDQFRAVQAP